MLNLNSSENDWLKPVCDFFRERQDWYLPRFGYAACELWLCTEICNIINFDHDLSFSKKNKDKFCFNEDEKRDLTLYQIDIEDKCEILSHIEVKLLYPGYAKSKRVSKLKELANRLTRETRSCSKSGWFFMIWASAKKGAFVNDSSFYDACLSDINEYFNHAESSYDISPAGIIDIIDGTFDWRGVKKTIIVKALSIHHK